MVAKILKEKFPDWEWKCQDCGHVWRSESYQCPNCGSLNSDRTFNWNLK